MPIFRILLFVFIYCGLQGQEYRLWVKGMTHSAKDSLGIANRLDDLISQGEFWNQSYILTDISAGDSLNLTYVPLKEFISIDSIYFISDGGLNPRVRMGMLSPLLGTVPLRESQYEFSKIKRNYSFLTGSSSLKFGRYEKMKTAAGVNLLPSFSSYMSGIAGISKSPEGEWSGTGELDIHLENIGGSGGVSAVRWRRPDRQSQYVELTHAIPFIFHLPFGMGATIIQDLKQGLYVSNSTTGYLTGVSDWGRWSFGGNTVELHPTENGDSLGITSSRVRSVITGLQGDTRNNRWLPTSGAVWRIHIHSGWENRQGTKSKILQWNSKGGVFIPAWKTSKLYIGYITKGVYSESPTHFGQKIRYGGTTTLRGYRENQFESEKVCIGIIEWGITYENKTQLYIFGDGALQREVSPIPYGVGVGIRQNSQRTVLSLAYGISRDDRINGGKLHIRITTKL